MSLNYVQRSGVCKLFRVILLLHYLSGWYLIWKFCVFDTVCTLLFRRYSPGETLAKMPSGQVSPWPFHGDPSWRLISQCTTISAEWNTLPVRWWMTSNVGSFNPPKEHWKWCIVFYTKKFAVRTKCVAPIFIFLHVNKWYNCHEDVLGIGSWSLTAIRSWRAWTGPSKSREQLLQARLLGKYIDTRYHPPEACFRCLRLQCALTISCGSDWETNGKETQSAMDAQTAKRRPWNNLLIQLVVQRWRQSDVGQASLTLTSI